jgi:hypothetical protein
VDLPPPARWSVAALGNPADLTRGDAFVSNANGRA